MPAPQTLPFEPGKTMFDGNTVNDTDYLGILGNEYEIEDTYFGTGRKITYRVVKNSSGYALAPKRLVKLGLTTTTFKYGTHVDGYNVSNLTPAFPVDHLISGSVPDKDIFYIVTKGPMTAVTATTGQGANIAVGDLVAALTIAATTTDGGKVDSFVAAATTHPAGLVHNLLARAMSARTTGETAKDILLDWGAPF